MNKPTAAEVATIRKFLTWGSRIPGFPYSEILYWLDRWMAG